MLTENPQQAAKEVRQMSQGAGWQILQAHLLKQCQQKATARSEALRKGDFNLALRFQERVDTLEWVIGEVVNLSKVKEEKHHPSY